MHIAVCLSAEGGVTVKRWKEGCIRAKACNFILPFLYIVDYKFYRLLIIKFIINFFTQNLMNLSLVITSSSTVIGSIVIIRLYLSGFNLRKVLSNHINKVCESSRQLVIKVSIPSLVYGVVSSA